MLHVVIRGPAGLAQHPVRIEIQRAAGFRSATVVRLDGAGRANSGAGDGRLSPQPPAGLATDTYLYDPQRPVPTLGGRVMLPTTANAAGAVDQRAAEARDDVLSVLLRARDEEGRGMSDVELRDELVTLLEAGHETTATALGWAFERLVRTHAAL